MPELFHAHIGVAQMSTQLKSEQAAYDCMLRRFRDAGDSAMVRRLEAAPVGDRLPLPERYMAIRDVAMHRLGVRTTHDMRSIESGIVVPSFLSPIKRFYTFERSAHSPLFEEPEQVCTIMRRDVLTSRITIVQSSSNG